MNSATAMAASASAAAKPARAASKPASTRPEPTRSLGIMQGVGRERVAAGLAGDALQRAPAEGIDGDRGDDRGEGEAHSRGRRRCRRAGGPRDERDAEASTPEKAGLGQRRDRLDLGVAERVALVGGLVGDAHGEIGEAAGGDVERVMRAFGDERERAGDERRRRA